MANVIRPRAIALSKSMVRCTRLLFVLLYSIGLILIISQLKHNATSESNLPHLPQSELSAAPMQLLANRAMIAESRRREVRRQQMETYSSSTRTTLRRFNYSLFNSSCPPLKHGLGLPVSLASFCRQAASQKTTPRKVNITAAMRGILCVKLTCRNMLTGNVSADVYKIGKLFMRENPKLETPVSEFVKLTADCETFRRDGGYERKIERWSRRRDAEDGGAGTSEGERFSIAFNFIVHRNFEQAERLLYALYRPEHQFCIHVDHKSSSDFLAAFRGVARCLPNVFIASKLERVVWSGYSRLQADINCMKDHIARNKSWSYIVNTAGEAFPLRSTTELINILQAYNGSNDIEGLYGKRIEHLKTLYEREYKESWDTTHMFLKNKKTGAKKKPPPHDIDIVKGSAYGAFSRRFIEFILTDPIARDFLKWSETTWSPDEFYWATLNHRYANPHIRAPGGYGGQPIQAHWMAAYANWGDSPCLGKVRRGICIGGMRDIPRLVKKPQLFINKFYDRYEPMTLECLRSWIEYKEYCPVNNFDLNFYREMPRVVEQQQFNVVM